MSAASIRLYQTAEHACGYWPERSARDLLLDPHEPQLAQVYPQMVALGFRRSGSHVYRPRCSDCAACIPLRVPIATFVPDRSQRRCLQRNADLTVTEQPARFDRERYALYRRYLAGRHPDGSMATGDERDFATFLSADWSPTRFLEVRLHDRLLAVAVTDVLPNALSAVYTFYDPDEHARGLGTFGVLQQIEWARRTGREHLYLGFWLQGHPKMHYKARFGPAEILRDGQWQVINL